MMIWWDDGWRGGGEISNGSRGQMRYVKITASLNCETIEIMVPV